MGPAECDLAAERGGGVLAAELSWSLLPLGCSSLQGPLEMDQQLGVGRAVSAGLFVVVDVLPRLVSYVSHWGSEV